MVFWQTGLEETGTETAVVVGSHEGKNDFAAFLAKVELRRQSDVARLADNLVEGLRTKAQSLCQRTSLRVTGESSDQRIWINKRIIFCYLLHFSYFLENTKNRKWQFFVFAENQEKIGFNNNISCFLFWIKNEI